MSIFFEKYNDFFAGKTLIGMIFVERDCTLLCRVLECTYNKSFSNCQLNRSIVFGQCSGFFILCTILIQYAYG